MPPTTTFDPTNVNLNIANRADVICYIYGAANNYNGQLAARISSVFVVLITSTVVTFFPVVARRIQALKIPNMAYVVARYLGSGVILATAFVHLLDPSYYEIGSNTCVGMTGNWTQYSWPPAFVLAFIAVTFMLDFGASLYVESKYGITRGQSGSTKIIAGRGAHEDEPFPRLDGEMLRVDPHHQQQAQGIVVSSDQQQQQPGEMGQKQPTTKEQKEQKNKQQQQQQQQSAASLDSRDLEALEDRNSVRQHIAAFLILEFGVLFHSVIIGLTLGVVGKEFKILYVVIIFHQSFEGLGIGARLSAIPFEKGSWIPWILCLAYGLTTPISIAAGLGVRETVNLNSFNANIVQGVLDASSAGVLVYTSLVELIAHDFIFNPDRTRDKKELTVMLVSFFSGTGLMALLGKWI